MRLRQECATFVAANGCNLGPAEMPARGLVAKAGMIIRLPAGPGGNLVVELPDGRTLSSPRDAPPEELRAAAVWETLADWDERVAILEKLGAGIADWLLEPAARAALAELRDARQEDGIARAVALEVPDWLVEYPWEAAWIPELGAPIGVSLAFTVYRLVGGEPCEPAPRQVRMVLVAPPSHLGNVADEVEKVRAAVSQMPALTLEVDGRGNWDKHAARIRQRGSPDVWHFAGEGLDDGAGLEFAGQEQVLAAQLTQLFADAEGTCRLVVLSACTTAATSDRALRPFGGLAQRLSAQGIPAVIAAPAPLPDPEAPVLASRLYARLVAGDAVDAALQHARSDLFARKDAAWALVQLVVRGEPPRLLDPTQHKAVPDVDRALMVFGFQAQRNRLAELLVGQQSLVIVIHGKQGTGHGHLIDQVRSQIQANHPIWVPVREISWGASGEALIDENMMLGAIAQALGLSSGGARKELERRIIDTVLSQRKQRSLVVEVNELCMPQNRPQALAVGKLVRTVWANIARALKGVPTFLVLPIGHPDKAGSSSRQAVKLLTDQPAPAPGVRVVVLDELKPIEEDEVVSYLEAVAALDRKDAKKKAQFLVRYRTNENAIEMMRNYLSQLEGQP